jgi:hypothetical protein
MVHLHSAETEAVVDATPVAFQIPLAPLERGHDFIGRHSDAAAPEPLTSTAVYTALAPNRFKDFWRD